MEVHRRVFKFFIRPRLVHFSPVQCHSLRVKARLKLTELALTLFSYKPAFFSYVNDYDQKLLNIRTNDLHTKSSEASNLALISLKGHVAQHTTVKSTMSTIHVAVLQRTADMHETN